MHQTQPIRSVEKQKRNHLVQVRIDLFIDSLRDPLPISLRPQTGKTFEPVQKGGLVGGYEGLVLDSRWFLNMELSYLMPCLSKTPHSSSKRMAFRQAALGSPRSG